MKRYLIQLTNDSSYFDNEKKIFYFNEEECLDFYRIINDLALINDFNENTIVSCEICTSIIIGAEYFYYFIRNILNIMDERSLSLDKYSYRDTLYDDLSMICDDLIEVHLLSDEEWGIYYTIGLPDIEVVKENNSAMTDTEGNLYVFVYDEVGLQTDPTCFCYRIIAHR
ncbi:MAG TPA: hypothetical protein PLA74_07250 [Syntrophales bacterium]|nr:hypothetical protein [Syntrophales bacterium]